MYREQTVAVVIPVYNEVEFVGEVIDTVPDFVDRIYAVDDRSTDGTWNEIMKRSWDDASEAVQQPAHADGGIARPRLIPIRHTENKGVGGAIKTGYKEALADGVDVVAVMNGDGQMDPDILDEIIDPVASGAADYSKGNRLASPEDREEMPTWRLTGNMILTFLTKVASGYWGMTDPQNGYTAISRDALEAVDIDALYDRYGFLNDLLVQLNTQGFTIADVPMEAVYGEEESGIKYSQFVPHLSFLLLTGFLHRLTVKYVVSDFHPLVLGYVLAFVGGAAGIAATALSLVGAVAGVLPGLLMLVGSAITFALAVDVDRRHSASLERHSF